MKVKISRMTRKIVLCLNTMNILPMSRNVLGSMKKTGRMHLIARRDSAASVEKIVKERLQPVLKGLEAVQLGIQRLSGRDKEERRKEQGSDADDEDEEVNFKKPGILGIEKIKSAVIEAMRQEKQLYALHLQLSTEAPN